MARTKTSKAWMHEHVTDPYVRRAKKDGYRSRAAYKLLEVLEKDKLVRPGMTVVDLGAAPGGWSQVLAPLVGSTGRVIALDVLDMDPIEGVVFIRGEFSETTTLERLEQELSGRGIDLVISDMAPNISGVGLVDQARSIGLAELALEFACSRLKPGGSFLVKMFQGTGIDEFRKQLALAFSTVSVRKPKASRDRSSELYLLARGKRSVR
ncbi:MAG TPA: RlmE family RNA methyltransferase [Burkholderiales bacterium]|jgi:23S rRNA (uridine2552-2'-O)-methyltransferase|nr:RlmE family RNA methyltransferase [Burkholderiales bacterium]